MPQLIGRRNQNDLDECIWHALSAGSDKRGKIIADLRPVHLRALAWAEVSRRLALNDNERRY